MSKATGKVRLCPDPVHSNQALIRQTHRGPTLNGKLPKLNHVKYLSGYHNLKLDEKSLYLTTFACQFGQFGAAAGDMFQGKISEIFNDMPNVFGIADDILVVGYEDDGRDHDESVQKVLQRCRKVNLKLIKISVISGVHLFHSLER